MGYSTDFFGEFSITPALKPEHKAYLEKFADTRRMKRDAAITEQRPDPARVAANLPVGPQGAYFVGAGGDCGQEGMWGSEDREKLGILDSNKPPEGQPGLWCQWIPNQDGTELGHDGGEKSYHWEEWLQYLIKHFLQPWGYSLDGEVHWQGEESNDRGCIYAKGSQVEAVNDEIVNAAPSWFSE